MPPSASERIDSLDLIRGIAVLGILTVNIAGYAASSTDIYAPDRPVPGGFADHLTFAGTLLLFEGKMRALFTMLFGASLLLFVNRAEARGQDGVSLQGKRLIWLIVIGYLHYALLWWGDILFVYGVLGFVALALHQMRSSGLIAIAILAFSLTQVAEAINQFPLVQAQMAEIAGKATTQQTELLNAAREFRANGALQDLGALHSTYLDGVAARLRNGSYPLLLTWSSMGETIPFMVIGMLLMRSGLFYGTCPRTHLRGLAIAGLLVGGGATLLFVHWLWQHGFPEEAVRWGMNYGMAYPHLIMALAYVALLALAAPYLLRTSLAKGLQAAGRMALTNYVGTSLMMTAIFCDWGLSLGEQFGDAMLVPFILLGWAVMVIGSLLWLRRFRMGPLEWLWRSLTETRVIPLFR